MWVANIPENVASVVDTGAVGPGRPRVRTAGLQAAGRRARPRQGLRQHLPEHRLAARSTPSTRWPARREGYLAYKIHPHYFWDPATAPADARPTVQHRLADIETCRAGPRGGRSGLRADVRPVGHLSHRRGGAQGRPRAREARLPLVRAPDAGVPGRELRAARPRADHPDPVARDRRRRRLHAAPTGSCAAPPT